VLKNGLVLSLGGLTTTVYWASVNGGEARESADGGGLVPRWKHLLLLGGVLSADQERSQLPRVTRTSLEQAFCRAVNLSVESNARHGNSSVLSREFRANPWRLELEADVLSLVLSHAVQCLSRRAKEAIHYDVSSSPQSLIPF